MRRTILALLMATAAAEARGELPVIAPQSETVAAVPETPAPVAVRPLEAAVPVLGSTQSYTVATTTWTVNCQPAAYAAVSSDPCTPSSEKRPGVLRGLKNWLCGTGKIEACPVACPAPAVCAVAMPVVKPCPAPVTKPCPAPVIMPCPMPVRPTVECSTCEVGTKSRLGARGGACYEKIKAWFCWKPCNEQLLPVFCPTPYQAPAMAYLGACREPAAPYPCGTCKKPAKAATCETGTCPQPVGPVVAKASPIIGWTPIYANYTAPASNVVPAGAILPVAKPQPVNPVNPIARPFTSP